LVDLERAMARSGCYGARGGAGQAIAAGRRKTHRGGKSGLQWTRCQVTPGGREPTESATESKPPKRLVRSNPIQVPARVKRCGKSAPRRWQHSTAWKTPPGARPNREVAGDRKILLQRGSRALPGRLLKGCGDAVRRGMIALDRTRLIGRLPLLSSSRCEVFCQLVLPSAGIKRISCDTHPTFHNSRKSLCRKQKYCPAALT